MQFNRQGFNKGKVVYWISGQRFENSPNKRDGKEKAERYCLDNFLNPSDIKKFDSRTECNRYEYLLSLQEQGKITNLGHHFTLKIQDEYVNCNGDLIPAITYEADFVYREIEGEKRIVEDVKGSEYFIDERFLTLKQVFDKLMYEKGLYIRVMLFRNNEWKEWHIGDVKKQGKLIKKQREEIKTLRKEKHAREIEDNKRGREIARYEELKLLLRSEIKLSSSQQKRYEELKEKYGEN